MPYANEMPGAGGGPANRSRRKGEKHALIIGAIAGPLAGITATLLKGNSVSAGLMLELLGAAIGGAIAGAYGSLLLLSPLLGFFYQWRLIRYRERNGIPHPTPHSYRGDKWLELDDDDPLREEVDARLRAVQHNMRIQDGTEDWPDILR